MRAGESSERCQHQTAARGRARTETSVLRHPARARQRLSRDPRCRTVPGAGGRLHVVPLQVVSSILPSRELLPVLVDLATWAPRSLGWCSSRRYERAESTLRSNVDALRHTYSWGDRRFGEGLDRRVEAGPLSHFATRRETAASVERWPSASHSTCCLTLDRRSECDKAFFTTLDREMQHVVPCRARIDGCTPLTRVTSRMNAHTGRIALGKHLRLPSARRERTQGLSSKEQCTPSTCALVLHERGRPFTATIVGTRGVRCMPNKARARGTQTCVAAAARRRDRPEPRFL